jgi:hypothetical protein
VDLTSTRQTLCVAGEAWRWAQHVEELLEKPVEVAVAVSGKLAPARSSAEESWDSRTLPLVRTALQEFARMGRHRSPGAVEYDGSVERHMGMAQVVEVVRAARFAGPLGEVASGVAAAVVVVWVAEAAASAAPVAGFERAVVEVEVVDVGKAAAAVGQAARIVEVVEAAQVGVVGLCSGRSIAVVSADCIRSEDCTAGYDSMRCGSAENMRHWYTAGLRWHYLYTAAGSVHIEVQHWYIGRRHSHTAIRRWRIAAFRRQGVVTAVGHCRLAPGGTSLDMSLHWRGRIWRRDFYNLFPNNPDHPGASWAPPLTLSAVDRGRLLV